MNRKAKIIATLGPSSNTPKTIGELMDAGINVARLNFSHGTHQSHLDLINMIRSISKTKNHAIPILQDLQGPKLRVGNLPKNGVHLIANEIIAMELDINHHENDYEENPFQLN